jgi:protein kinase
MTSFSTHFSESVTFRESVSRMKRFEELEVLGNGAFGTVTKCRDKETGEIIAIKKMKQRYGSFEECLQLKEVKSLRKIKHPNIVKLLQVFRENEYLFLVFELLGKSLLKTATERGCYPENDVRSIMWQVLTGLAYAHRQGFFHRDLKPDNLLWKDDVLKIADFGLAREIRSRPPYTEYCGTRWYRAPEIILRSEFYNSPVDIWAAGVIMVELVTGRAIFQGTSENDQIYKIFGILGTPTQRTWADGIRLANRMGIRFPTTVSVGLASAAPNASPDAMGLMTEMLRFDPARRPSAAQALQHDFFKTNLTVSPGGSRSGISPGESELEGILTMIVNSSSDAPQESDREGGGSPFSAAAPMGWVAREMPSESTSPHIGRSSGRHLYEDPPPVPFDDDLFAGL